MPTQSLLCCHCQQRFRNMSAQSLTTQTHNFQTVSNYNFLTLFIIISVLVMTTTRTLFANIFTKTKIFHKTVFVSERQYTMIYIQKLSIIYLYRYTVLLSPPLLTEVLQTFYRLPNSAEYSVTSILQILHIDNLQEYSTLSQRQGKRDTKRHIS